MRIVGRRPKTIKLKPQKSPKHSSKWLDQEADLKARAKFDSIFDTGKGSASKGFSKVGMGIASTKHAAATTLASKTAGKYWSKNLPKELRKQRSTIAGFARTNRSKVSVKGLQKAKEKGFIKTLTKQDKKFETIRSKTSELFTRSKGTDPFKTYTKKTIKKFVSDKQGAKIGFAPKSPLSLGQKKYYAIKQSKQDKIFQSGKGYFDPQSQSFKWRPKPKKKF